MLTTWLPVMHVAVLVVFTAYLVVTIWAIVRTLQDRKLRTGDKATWIVALVIIPIFALVVWFAVRARGHPRNAEQG